MSMDLLLSKLRSALKEQKLKNTLQRELILEAMYETSGHHTPEEIASLTNAKGNGVGLATVYRTLGFFEKVGIASSFSVGSDGKKYELSTQEHHDHLICITCGEIEEFNDDSIEVAQESIASQRGFELIAHEMKLYGRCKKCQTNKKARR